MCQDPLLLGRLHLLHLLHLQLLLLLLTHVVLQLDGLLLLLVLPLLLGEAVGDLPRQL